MLPKRKAPTRCVLKDTNNIKKLAYPRRNIACIIVVPGPAQHRAVKEGCGRHARRMDLFKINQIRTALLCNSTAGITNSGPHVDFYKLGIAFSPFSFRTKATFLRIKLDQELGPIPPLLETTPQETGK